MPTIHRGEYFLVQHHHASAYVRVIRSEAPFGSAAEAVKALAGCRTALSSVSVTHTGILFDWRRSPISTDPNLHKALVEHIDAIAEPYARRAILLSTTVGIMQAARVGRTMGNQKMTIFDDETAAVEFVIER